MALVGPASYLPTAQDFREHWRQVEATGKSVVLQNGFGSDDFDEAIAALQAALTALGQAETAQQTAIAQRDAARAPLPPLLERFKGALGNQFAGTPYNKNAPRQPDPNAAESKFLAPFEDMRNQWQALNALAPNSVPGFTAPLVLGDGTTLAAFDAKIAAARAAHRAVDAAEAQAARRRAERNALLPPLKERLKQYKSALVGIFGANHPLVQSVPRLSPAPGTTPPRVTVSGAWDAAQNRGVLTIEPLPDSADIAEYEVRYSPTRPYSTNDETVIGAFAPGQTTFETVVGLAAPGASAGFKVYARTSGGNERGSAVVTIKRSAG